MRARRHTRARMRGHHAEVRQPGVGPAIASASGANAVAAVAAVAAGAAGAAAAVAAVASVAARVVVPWIPTQSPLWHKYYKP